MSPRRNSKPIASRAVVGKGRKLMMNGQVSTTLMRCEATTLLILTEPLRYERLQKDGIAPGGLLRMRQLPHRL